MITNIERDKRVKKLTGLKDEDIVNISHQIADAFYDYEYNKDDEGLIKYIKSILINKGEAL